MFESNEFKSGKNGRPSTLKQLDFSLSVKCPNAYLGTRVYQSQILEEGLTLLLAFYKSFANDIGFPELAFVGIQTLKRFSKMMKVIFLRDSIIVSSW